MPKGVNGRQQKLSLFGFQHSLYCSLLSLFFLPYPFIPFLYSRFPQSCFGKYQSTCQWLHCQVVNAYSVPLVALTLTYIRKSLWVWPKCWPTLDRKQQHLKSTNSSPSVPLCLFLMTRKRLSLRDKISLTWV